jgi:hypothetical protein
MDTRSAKRVATSIVAVLTISIGGMVFTASPALAFPSGCNAVPADDEGGEAYCTGGTGEFRVYVRCSSWPYKTTSYGPWRIPGQGLTSKAKCPSFYDRTSVGMNLIGPIG